MPLLRSVAEDLSNNFLEQGVVEEIIDRESLFAMLPFTPVANKAYVYNREDVANPATVSFMDVNGTIPENAGRTVPKTETLKIIAGDVDVDKFLIKTMGDTNDQLSIALGLKAKAMSRQIKDSLINGDSNAVAQQFDGLNRICTVESRTQALGGALTLATLDSFKDEIKRGADAFMMNQRTWRAIRELYRAAGGNTADMYIKTNFGMPLPAYDGTVVIINDFIPVVANNTDVYALRLNESDGFHGLIGSNGIEVEEIGTVQNKDSYRYRIKTYMGTCLKSTDSVYQLTGVAV